MGQENIVSHPQDDTPTPYQDTHRNYERGILLSYDPLSRVFWGVFSPWKTKKEEKKNSRFALARLIMICSPLSSIAFSCSFFFFYSRVAPGGTARRRQLAPSARPRGRAS